MPRDEARDDDYGVLWRNEGKYGEYYSGFVGEEGEQTKVVVFPNNKKKSDRSPDFFVKKAREKPPQPKQGEFQDDDIPFD